MSPPKIFTNYTGNKANFRVEKCGKYYPNQAIKEHITSNGTNQNYVPLDRRHLASLL